MEMEGYPAYEINPDKNADHPLAPYACTEKRKIVAFDPAKGILPRETDEKLSFSGRLVGGCLDILAMLCGTKYDHVKEFSEQYSGDGLIGRPWAGQEDAMGLDHIRAATDVLEELQVPILLDVDIGHLPPMIPLISGSMANVSYTPAGDCFGIRMALK